MTLDGYLIFYWIYKKYPRSVYFFGGNGDNVQQVSRPMFWDVPAAMRGHLVVVRPECWQQIVHQPYEALFLCVGSDPQFLAHGQNECIVIPDPVSVEEIFNLVLEIFEKFQLWEQKLQLAVDTLLSYGAIIRSCDDLIAEPMALVDDHFRYVSYSKRKTIEIGWEDKYVSSNSALPLDVINLLTALPEFKGLETERDVFVHVGAEHLLQKNVYDGERYVGRLSIRHHKNNTVNLYHRQILRIVASYIEKLYARLGSFWHRQKKNKQERQLLASVLQGSKPPVAQITHALSFFPFRRGRRWWLCCCNPMHPPGMISLQPY